MKLTLTNFAIRHPWGIIVATAVAAIAFTIQFPRVKFDNDPENMLAEHEPVRVFHSEVKQRFNLYDFVIVGIVNETNANGVFNVETLGRIHRLTNELRSLHRGADGLPTVREQKPDGTTEDMAVDLSSGSSLWRRLLNVAFRQDPNHLFTDDGDSAIIAREIISPSVIDNLKQAELGALKVEYLMEEAPTTEAAALRIRDDAMANPLYKDTVASGDGKAVAMYVPIADKTYSYNVAELVRQLTVDWPPEDQVYITGLPVAEDTFGVEMLVQMATSAPLAGLMIFLLLLLFFRKLNLILAPMILAVVSVVAAMGLLIGLGFDVHIMSSMIAIFVMPIAVVDAIHMLSEFHDVYQKFNDKAETLRHVIGHLFMPMLYTTLTTMAGFASLAMTPIPPVRVFGLHVAFGVGVAWVLTMTFIPAFVMIFVPEKSLASFGKDHAADGVQAGPMGRLLERVGRLTYTHWKVIVGATLLIVLISAFGISRIRVNDNPVKWFEPDHRIRVADEVLNRHFAGTYTAYLVLTPEGDYVPTCRERAATIRQRAREHFGDVMPAALDRFVAELDKIEQEFANARGADPNACFVDLANAAGAIDETAVGGWNALMDTVLLLDPEGLTRARLDAAIDAAKGASDREKDILRRQLEPHRALTGPDLQNAAADILGRFTSMSFRDWVFDMQAELTAPTFKKPAVLRWIAGFEEYMASQPVFGKSSTAVDALKKANYELNYVPPPADATADEQRAFATRNNANYAVPDNVSAVAQVYIQLEGMKKKDALFHLVTRDYQQANVWMQLKSGDNKDMEGVVRAVKDYVSVNPPPVPLNVDWAGLTYLNVVWQDKMVKGMLSSLAGSFVVVLVMMAVLFRSVIWGLLCMVPLSVTIAFIYGLIGLAGKDYDMPVAVLSSLTLGLSVDFAIHFLERAREMTARHGSWKAASGPMFAEPATAITRNAIVIAVGFTPLLLAPLVPYQTVGFFLASIMAVSGVATLLILPALLTLLDPYLFKQPRHETAPETTEEPE